MVVVNGITRRSILTTLFNIYAYLNDMKTTYEFNGQYFNIPINTYLDLPAEERQKYRHLKGVLTSTALMDQYLGQSYNKIVEKEIATARVAYEKAGSPLSWPRVPVVRFSENGERQLVSNQDVPAHLDSKGKIVAWFDPKSFGFKNFSQIASANIFTKDELANAGQPLEVTEQDINYLDNEQRRTSANLYYYGWYRDIEESTKLSAAEKQFKMQELAQKYQLIVSDRLQIKIKNAEGRAIENPDAKISLKTGK